MNRAERRRQGRVENDPTLCIKKSEMDKILTESYQKGYKKGQESIKKDTVNTIFLQLLGIPCKVLRDCYGWGYKVRLPRFADQLLEEYQKFEDNPDVQKTEQLQQWIADNVGIRFFDTEAEADQWKQDNGIS